MARMRCLCGEVDNILHERYEFHLMPEDWIINVCYKLEIGKLSDDELFESFMAVQQRFYRCPECSRIWCKLDDGNYLSYIPEYKSRKG